MCVFSYVHFVCSYVMHIRKHTHQYTKAQTKAFEKQTKPYETTNINRGEKQTWNWRPAKNTHTHTHTHQHTKKQNISTQNTNIKQCRHAKIKKRCTCETTITNTRNKKTKHNDIRKCKMHIRKHTHTSTYENTITNYRKTNERIRNHTHKHRKTQTWKMTTCENKTHIQSGRPLRSTLILTQSSPLP